jgi:predicted transcriptional regulator
MERRKENVMKTLRAHEWRKVGRMVENGRKQGFEEEGEKEKKKEEKEVPKNIGQNIEGSLCSKYSKGTSKGSSEKNLRKIADYEVLEKLGESISAMSNAVRIRMLTYCLKERSFTDIMLELRLNPASLKHHQDLLLSEEFIERTGKGKDTRYRTTDLGKKMLSFVEDVLKAVRQS